MAISPIVIAWLSSLTSRGVLRGGSMLEMGPSDLILYTPAAVEHYIRRHVSADQLRPLMDEIFDDKGVFRRDGTPALYRGLGYGEYRSIDLGDSRADWNLDLNYPVEIPDRFEAVANFGTGEHVFNLAEMFRSIHRLLKEGGVQLHVMPTYGDSNHGFFNIHPTFYLDLAAANDYVVEDIRYIDQINRRTDEHTRTLKVDFDALPIDREKLESHLTLGGEIDKHHLAVQKWKRRSIKDYLFVALRKTKDQPFRIPVQSLYADMKAAGIEAAKLRDAEGRRPRHTPAPVGWSPRPAGAPRFGAGRQVSGPPASPSAAHADQRD